MSIDGTWHLTVQSPLGEQKTSVTLSSAGGALTGRQSQGAASTDIKDGTVSGDTIAGQAVVSGLGAWKFTGVRG